MKNIIIDNCPACEPINRLIKDIENKGFKILESKLEDYHFRQLYIKVEGELSELKNFDLRGFSVSGNFLICDCHWSRIEFVKEPK